VGNTVALRPPSVPWQTFCTYPDGAPKFDDAWLLTPENVVSYFGDDTYCRLCDSYFTAGAADHVAAHAPSLRAWREQQGRNGRASDPDLEEKFTEAVRLVNVEGLSQSKAAATAGVPRSTLQRRIQGSTGADSGPAHARIGDSTRSEHGPPQTALQTNVSGQALEEASAA
jgi:hypothetical protein